VRRLNRILRSICFLAALLLLVLQISVLESPCQAEEPAATRIVAGSRVDLFRLWPAIAKAPSADMATLEVLIRPDVEAVNRSRAFVLVLSNSGGRDAAGISLALNSGAVRASVLGTRLDAPQQLRPAQWSHVALTIDSRKVNRQARLWVNGQQVAESLILEYWPQNFQVAEMLSDKWNQGRVFTGELGDVRISRTVRYTQSFKQPITLPKDDDSVLRLNGNQIPLDR
jgi:hypothetical protein